MIGCGIGWKLKTLFSEVGKIDERDFRVNRVEIWAIRLLREVFVSLYASDKICQIIKKFQAITSLTLQPLSDEMLLHSDTTPNVFLLVVTCRDGRESAAGDFPLKACVPDDPQKKSKAQTSRAVSANSLSVSTIKCTARHIPYLIFTFTAPERPKRHKCSWKIGFNWGESRPTFFNHCSRF